MGVDENGLGPRLGPLLVTSVVARAEGAGERVASRKPPRSLAARVGDSKALVSYKDSALGEAWGRVLLEATGRSAQTPSELLRALSIDDDAILRSPCPTDHAAQCWDDHGETFASTDETLAAVRKDLRKLTAKGVHVAGVRLAIVCTHRLNEAARAGRSRFVVDLNAMERLVLAAREHAGEDVIATCGKVGGYDRYSPAFGPLGGRLHAVVQEGRARSEYAFPGVGRVAFVRDADASHLLVCLASLVGKWARDALMARIVRYHRAEDATLPEVSGYHDPITARFVEASALVRKKRGLPDRCFERVKAS